MPRANHPVRTSIEIFTRQVPAPWASTENMLATTLCEMRQRMKRIVRSGQLYRDLAPDMLDRDRRLRVTGIGEDGRAQCLVEHDHGGTTGKARHIQVRALATPSKFDLIEDASSSPTDPRFATLMAAIAQVHTPAATPLDYARAAWEALNLENTANHKTL